MESWALKAVEDAAMRRAWDFLKSPEYLETHLMIMGVTFKQVRALVDYYEKTTGKSASTIDAA